jgi:hypothetical protein
MDCKFSKKVQMQTGFLLFKGTYLCEHPLNQSPVTGEFIDLACWNMRLSNGACGPEGKFFAGKEVQIVPFK